MRPSLPWLIAAILLGGLQAAGADPAAPIAVAASAVHRAKIEAYLRARTAYEKEASALQAELRSPDLHELTWTPVLGVFQETDEIRTFRLARPEGSSSRPGST